MGYGSDVQRPVRWDDLMRWKVKGEKFACITCYDHAFARLVARSDIPVVLVGDSLGNVVLGFESTLPVRLDDMISAAAAVRRGLGRQLMIVDMPLGTYGVTAAQAAEHAVRLVQQGGAMAVKLEGAGPAILDSIAAITGVGIPVVGHLGYGPQSLHAIGGARVQGRDDEGARRLIADARALELAGVRALVLELVPAVVADQVTRCLAIPTIGIGASASCDGQILVLHDMLGFDDAFTPKFLKRYASMSQLVPEALSRYARDVQMGVFPGPEHEYSAE